MANFGGVYFLTFFQKTNRFGARRPFLEVQNQEMLNMLWCQHWYSSVILRHLECFFEKMSESRPPLKWPILGGSTFYHFFKKLTISKLRHIFWKSLSKKPFNAQHRQTYQGWLDKIDESFQKEHNLFKLDTNNTFLYYSVKLSSSSAESVFSS